MVQRYNRHLSISIYIAALAITDTIALFRGKDFFSVLGKTLSGVTQGKTDWTMH